LNLNITDNGAYNCSYIQFQFTIFLEKKSIKTLTAKCIAYRNSAVYFEVSNLVRHKKWFKLLFTLLWHNQPIIVFYYDPVERRIL